MLRMKTQPAPSSASPIVVRDGGAVATIYPTRNRVYRNDPVTGERVLTGDHDQFTVVYWHGKQRVKRKFADLAKARAEAELAVVKLANGESEILKLSGTERGDYVKAIQTLHRWRPNADLSHAVRDFVDAAARLPQSVTLKEAIDFYLKRHPAGLQTRSVQEVADELIAAKAAARKSAVYLKDLESRLRSFANAFQLPIATITSQQIEAYLRGLGLSPRSQNNHRRVIGTLVNFAIKRKYLPRDFSELDDVERVQDTDGEIEIFTPLELRRLFTVARPEMIPYLAIAAFAGLRAAEIQRLDWSRVKLAERHIEVTAGIAKTASRRIAPISENLAAWLAPHVRPAGPVTQFLRADKQLFHALAPKAGVPWRHNGLRHSFVSYRVAQVKNCDQVALEAGNSPRMIFKHYRQLVTEKQAAEWFSILPPTDASNIVPLPAVAA